MASVGWLIVLAAAELGACGAGRCGMGSCAVGASERVDSGAILGWFFGLPVIPLGFAGSGCLGLNCKCTAEGGALRRAGDRRRYRGFCFTFVAQSDEASLAGSREGPASVRHAFRVVGRTIGPR